MADEEMVPLARLTAVVTEREAAKAEATRLRTELATAKTEGASVATVQTAYDAFKAEASKAAAGWATERTLLEAGLRDPDAREVATLLYGKLPVEERPALAAWLDAMKTDPTKAPKPLAPYFVTAATTTTTAATTVAGTTTPVRPAGTEHTTGALVTPEALRAAGERARITGDRKEYDALRAQVMAQLAGR